MYLLVGSHPHKRSNAAALMGIYCVLHLGWTPVRRRHWARGPAGGAAHEVPLLPPATRESSEHSSWAPPFPCCRPLPVLALATQPIPAPPLPINLAPSQEEAYQPLRALEPFTGFRDASCGVPTYQLPVHQVIAGMWKAKEVGAVPGWLGAGCI